MSADPAAEHAPDPAAERLGAVTDALHKVQEQAAALEDLAEHLSLSVHVLEAEVAALARELRSRPAPATPGSRESADRLDSFANPSGPAPLSSSQPLAPPRSTDLHGAGLVALNMALGGKPREATARYLDEHFDLEDPQALLDEVYGNVTRQAST